uniref:Secreted protein n=1 Tax=Parastrongyloides trichosuri TaxID=131310 RepID=A0A0N5A022_PARTI
MTALPRCAFAWPPTKACAPASRSSCNALVPRSIEPQQVLAPRCGSKTTCQPDERGVISRRREKRPPLASGQPSRRSSTRQPCSCHGSTSVPETALPELQRAKCGAFGAIVRSRLALRGARHEPTSRRYLLGHSFRCRWHRPHLPHPADPHRRRLPRR